MSQSPSSTQAASVDTDVSSSGEGPSESASMVINISCDPSKIKAQIAEAISLMFMVNRRSPDHRLSYEFNTYFADDVGNDVIAGSVVVNFDTDLRYQGVITPQLGVRYEYLLARLKAATSDS